MPQRLFTNTQLFTIAGKRNPTRARGSPDLAGGAGPRRGGEGGSCSDPLRAERPCAQGAALAAGPARSAGTAAKSAFVFEAPRGSGLEPCSGLKGPGALKLSPGDAWRSPQPLLLPISPPTPLSRLQPGSGKLPAPETSPSKAELPDKKLNSEATTQPLIFFTFSLSMPILRLLKIPFLYSLTLSLPLIAFGDVMFVCVGVSFFFFFPAGPTLMCRKGSSLSSSPP